MFRGKVHPGYLVAIVAASNAGGAGSVIGDTTTTMIWIAAFARFGSSPYLGLLSPRCRALAPCRGAPAAPPRAAGQGRAVGSRRLAAPRHRRC